MELITVLKEYGPEKIQIKYGVKMTTAFNLAQHTCSTRQRPFQSTLILDDKTGLANPNTLLMPKL